MFLFKWKNEKQIKDELKDPTDKIIVNPDVEEKRVSVKTHIGNVRNNNEDNYLCKEDRGLYVVADGMGGHKAGEVASKIAVDMIEKSFDNDIQDGISNFIIDVLKKANDQILSEANENSECNGMGTTIALTYIKEDVLHYANVGDSRIYLCRDNRIIPLSEDHSSAADCIRNNDSDIIDVRNHPLRNRLTSALGIHNDFKKLYDTYILQKEDKLLLCTDGLWDMVLDEKIEQIMNQNVSLDKIAQELLTEALDNGGKDNITFIIVTI